MIRSNLASIALASTLLAAPTFAQKPPTCTREGLQSLAAQYVAAQADGGWRYMPGVGHTENFDDTSRSRLIAKPLKIDHHRIVLDTFTCETFTELIAADEATPYALGVRMRVDRERIAEIAVISATTGDVGFDAARYLKAASTEDWSLIPADKRDPRKVLEINANAYLDALLLGKADVEPWGVPCRNSQNGSCQVGLPIPAVNIANRRLIIDETIGAVAVICTFGADPKSGRIRTPDAHLFRIESGKVHFVHAITHLPESAARRTAQNR